MAIHSDARWWRRRRGRSRSASRASAPSSTSTSYSSAAASANDDLLLPDVRAAAAELLPLPPRVERAALGARAVSTGAVAVAVDAARQTLLRRLVETQPTASA
jgi:hypothetical protein